jgi:hypothetical protein
MRSLIVLGFLFFFSVADGQSNRSKLQFLPDSLLKKINSVKPIPGISFTTPSRITLPNGNGVVFLEQDRMPCVIPLTAAVMPNAYMNSIEKNETLGRIPNPALRTKPLIPKESE